MCYSARVIADYRTYVRQYNADIDIADFVGLYTRMAAGEKLKTPKAMDAAFQPGAGEQVEKIHGLVQEIRAAQVSTLEQDLFKQTRRLADAQRKLQVKETIKAQEDERISTKKIEQIKKRLANLKREELKDSDRRIFPGLYAPVMVWENGKRVVKPMRYQCRPAGKPANYDRRFPGTYNARRDNLEKFWGGLFGRSHAVIVADRFYENVDTPAGNAVLEFEPRSGEPMLIACLWSHWTDPRGKEPELLSFAAITDEPEPEVAAAGHDRTIVNLKPEHLDAWLNPEGMSRKELHELLEDRQHPYYEHRLAA